MSKYSCLSDDELMECIKFGEKKDTKKRKGKKIDPKLFEKLFFEEEKMKTVEALEELRKLVNDKIGKVFDDIK